MRSLIVFALLAFLAVAFVAARPAEDEESSSLAVVEIPALDSTNNGEETSEASAVEDESTTGASVEKHIRPFWPRFGGHGPVVIRRHPGFETILPVL
ncbi:uncharacterized protein LOC119553570 [Drosophila subpulchrella]|uniref:uncharacterized protein LOC119553570 n=1 Tax=Drosophila subpulchrella TaxID=1486046 RepID=UPI0018A128DD|nr:uncharacterized protein LOC119553570 [Drosophila subpulchrella]